MFCENCGKEIANGDSYCAECGAAVKKEMNIFENENKIILLLVMILGGAFGLHNFVLGETKKGVVRLLGTLLCGVVGTVLVCMDAVKLAKGTYVVDPEAFI